MDDYYAMLDHSHAAVRCQGKASSEESGKGQEDREGRRCGFCCFYRDGDVPMSISCVWLIQEQAASVAGVDGSKPSFFERTGKNAAQRSSMQMDICVQNITLYAGQVGGPGGGPELIDRGTLALTYATIADQEREWLLKMENLLVNDEVEEEHAGITLNEVLALQRRKFSSS
eukprot:749795-Hanusia_phi.AAC.11